MWGMVQHAPVDSKPSNQIRLWPENVEGLKKQQAETKLSITYLANATIRTALQAQDKKAKAKQK